VWEKESANRAGRAREIAFVAGDAPEIAAAGRPLGSCDSTGLFQNLKSPA
jgi:hypothetical protein